MAEEAQVVPLEIEIQAVESGLFLGERRRRRESAERGFLLCDPCLR
jgi:hypothetical protein